ncbi:MAG: restriction endonuclease subunit R [Candidatus Puniceispirillum sp.]|nr:restriction endonuclease subunit R [Candidatus Puniceispirillum sp.]
MMFTDLSFQGQWRDYQARVLEEHQDHLGNRRLHIVAAPGSGKTVLGLELMRRRAKPTLILAPTLTIRNQWIERLQALFLPRGAPLPAWISTDVRRPQPLTVITYQALHAAFCGEEGAPDAQEPSPEDEERNAPRKTSPSREKEIIKGLITQNIGTLILDEAHHLRNEWWKALTKLEAALQKPNIISLTATPPHDVEYAQWQKYEALCGPIDAEISVPELVKVGDLCPHQDYIHFSLPVGKEREKLTQFKQEISHFLQSLKRNNAFVEILATHPWIHTPLTHVEDILGDSAFFSAMVIFLNASGHRPHPDVAKILATGKEALPPITPQWLETLLTNVLYTHASHFEARKEVLEPIRQDLTRIGAIERRQVTIDHARKIGKMLAASLGKLESITQITRTEYDALGQDLRMVILADYIRVDELPRHPENLSPPQKIGVVPIFESLRRLGLADLKLGLLTGSLVLIPRCARPVLERVAAEASLDPSHLICTPTPHDGAYLNVQMRGVGKQKIVQLITEVFQAGAIQALVGTQALLGEGWDAPSLNTLILASHVGSYMLSNQMRGRAIRTHAKDPHKTSHIWHLATIDLVPLDGQGYFLFGEQGTTKEINTFDEVQEHIGEDVTLLRRRFRAFEGVSYGRPYLIENGFKRLDLSKVDWSKNGVARLNEATLMRAKKRDTLSQMWQDALEGASPKPEMREKLEATYAPMGFVYAHTLKAVCLNALIWGGSWASHILGAGRGSKNPFAFLALSLGVAGVLALPKLLRALFLFLRNGTLEGSMKQAAWAVLETLQSMDLVKTNPKNLRVQVMKDKMGVLYCGLEGATALERKVFLDAMQELLSPPESPRYLLVHTSKIGTFLRTNYHSVPTLMGQNKEHATFFVKRWQRYVGQADLVYTRTPEGRLILLRARTKSFASAFQRKTDRISIWE